MDFADSCQSVWSKDSSPSCKIYGNVLTNELDKNEVLEQTHRC